MNEFTDRNKKLHEYHVKYGYKLGIRPKLSTFRKKKIYDKYNGHCFYCGDLVGNNWHIDHRIPIAAGGNNEDENLVLSCAQCNECKNDKIFSSQYQFYINNSSEIVGAVRPYQLIRKQKNIDQDVYLTLYANSSNGYSNRTPDGYQRIAEWNWKYEDKLTKLTNSEAKLIIKYHNLLLKKMGYNEKSNYNFKF